MASEMTDDYPEQIKSLRAKLGLTQVALAERLGVSFPTVNRWENGKSRPSQLSWQALLNLYKEDEGMETTAESMAVAELEAPPYAAAPPLLDFTATPEMLRVLVEGERLSFGHLANPAFATEISNIDALPHQRLAVYDRMLPHARLRFLLADDAGAGKTIMTGLYVREMLSSRLLSRVLIVPPAGLVGNWQRELQILFNLSFRIVTGQDTKSGNPFAGPGSERVIVSVDTLAGGRSFARLAEDGVEPYDLVVFDEAHKLACDRGNDFRISKTSRYKLAEALAGVYTGDQDWSLPWHAHHLLLLTATPHMGKDYPYYALWRLLEPDVLTTFEAFEHFPPEKRQHYFIRRTKEEMLRLDGQPLYPVRQCDTLGFQLSTGDISEQRLYDETTEYLRHVYNKAKVLNRSAARLVMGVFQRRLASSTYALLCSFKRRIDKLDRIIEDIRTGQLTPYQLLVQQLQPDEGEDVLDSKSADEESGDDGLEENEVAEDKLLQGVIAGSLAELLAEREQVVALRDLAQQVHDAGVESKFDKLREVLTDSRFADEKMLIFTEHRDTMDFLVRRLGGLGYAGHIAQIHGGMPYTKRQEQIKRFRLPVEEGGARLMVCTDAAAEGVNLQFCWIMVNYDIPWNPARLEQRMGRIHRYGQKHDPVCIVNLVAPATREGSVLKTLLDKLEKIRKQLKSDKVFDSIGRVFAGVSLKDYMERALQDGAETVTKELDGQLTKEQVTAIEERERRLFGDGGDVKKELPRLREGIEHESFFRLLPGYVRHFVASAAPFVGLEVDGDPGATFQLLPARKGAADPLFEAMDSYPSDMPRRLSVQRPADPQACIWMHPGEQVFECFREMVRRRLGRDALKGAVFVDPTADKPYLFHLARLTVLRKADPEIADLAHEETVQCRLVGVRQTEEADISLCPVEHLLLLRGGVGLPASAQRLAVAASKLRDQANAYLMERVCRSLAVERRRQMLTVLPERVSFVESGFDFKEAELATARAKLTPKARQGNKGAAAEISRIKEQQRELRQRREQALASIHREPELMVPGGIDFIAHALVVPSDAKADREQLDAKVEQIAMGLVKAYEEASGATVRFVHTPELARAAGLPEHPGFDVLSMRPGNERRCIEVKGRAASGDIEVTDNEWARACNLRHEYWLYVAYHCATPTPQLIRVQDPFNKLLVRPFSKSQTVTRTITATIESGGVRISPRQVTEVGEA
ncbi:MAG: helix-turn-helix domain-containing protein [Lentisphaerae bacterium]|nr:helix-turn-helix domain-containing protein [Lentisphaerota bacterium]